MAKLGFFMDEDVYRATTLSLRKAGFDVISTPEVGRLGESDRVSATRRELRGPLSQSTTGREAEEFTGPGRATKALVALAVLVALAAILLVIFSVE